MNKPFQSQKSTPPPTFRHPDVADAEKRAVQATPPLEAMSPEAMRQMIHDLRMHQIQLEMQNEELRRAHADLRTSERLLRETEDELHNLRTAVEQSGNAIVITNLKGNIEYVNPAFEKSTGYTADEAMGDNPRVLKSGEQDAAFYKDLWETISSGKIWRGQFHNKRKDGSLYWESATISPVLNDRGEIVHFIAIKEDITERKSLEAKLSEALTRADSANRAKSEFLASMSHEIRTPMNGVIGMTDLLLDTEQTPQQHEYAEAIHSCGKALLTLINDILDFSKGEAGQIQLESLDFPIRTTIKEVVDVVAVEAQKKGIGLGCAFTEEIPEFLNGDPARLRQILFNLIGNAIKFTQHGGVTVRVEIFTEEETSLSLRFSVTDTGIGIPEDKLDSIFSKFTQGDLSTTRKFGGTGLGLAICKQLIQLFQGDITVTSQEGKGSTFSFTAAFRKSTGIKAHTPAESPGRHVGSARRRLRVLVAEDNTINRTLAVKMLEKLGHVVETAGNGKEAIEALRRMPYDLVFMDCQMPVMDGFEAMRAIRNPGSGIQNPGVPVIALTAYALKGDRDRCFAAGMSDYISKPATVHDLSAAIERCSTRVSQTGVGGDVPDARPGTLLDFDRKVFFERTIGDRDFAVEVATAFLADTPPLLTQLSEAITVGDARAARKFAHTLKGSSANMGGENLAQIAAQIETAGTEENLARQAELLPAARASLQKLSALLEQEFGLGNQKPT